jgi:hypothetical protein
VDGESASTGVPLSGIARLAAASSPAGEGQGLQVRSLKVRSILNRSVSRRGQSFTWSINPYRGCEFACRYCYARYTHEFMELPPEDFERRISVKENAAWLLEQELRQVRAHEESRWVRLPTLTSQSSGGPRSPSRCWKCWPGRGVCALGRHEINADRTRHSIAAENRGEKYAGGAPDDYYPKRGVGSTTGTAGAPA